MTAKAPIERAREPHPGNAAQAMDDLLASLIEVRVCASRAQDRVADAVQKAELLKVRLQRKSAEIDRLKARVAELEALVKGILDRTDGMVARVSAYPQWALLRADLEAIRRAAVSPAPAAKSEEGQP